MLAPGRDTQQIHPVYMVNSAPVLFEEQKKRVDKLGYEKKMCLLP